MSVTSNHVLSAVAIGVGASLLMDAWNLILKRAFSIPSLNYCLLGRWLLHMPEGTLLHSSIAAAPQKRLECGVGWVAHYTIGVVFALVFIVLAPGDWLSRPTILPALLYGIGTVVFGPRSAAFSRPRHRFVKDAQACTGQAEEPRDTYRFRSRAVSMRDSHKPPAGGRLTGCWSGCLRAALSGAAHRLVSAHDQDPHHYRGVSMRRKCFPMGLILRVPGASDAWGAFLGSHSQLPEPDHQLPGEKVKVLERGDQGRARAAVHERGAMQFPQTDNLSATFK